MLFFRVLMMKHVGFKSFTFIFALYAIVTKQTYFQGDDADKLGENTFILVGLFAEWCPFSSAFRPVFESGVKTMTEQFKDKVDIVMINSATSPNILKKLSVNKFPTVLLLKEKKFFKEFHGKRDVQSLIEFLKKHTDDKVKFVSREFVMPDDAHQLIIKSNKATADFFHEKFKQINLACTVYLNVEDLEFYQQSFHATFHGDHKTEILFNKTLANDQLDATFIELSELCTPFVRNINFNNAEEIIDSGNPLIILFVKDQQQKNLVKQFGDLVKSAILATKVVVTPVFALASEFSHPLAKIGKTEHDLPLVSLDDFSHFYVVEDYTKPGSIEEYLKNLASGYLHMKLHSQDYIIRKPNNRPNVISFGGFQIDIINMEPIKIGGNQIESGNDAQVDELSKNQKDGHDHHEDPNDSNKRPIPAASESVFVKLAPSSKRYSVHADEL